MDKQKLTTYVEGIREVSMEEFVAVEVGKLRRKVAGRMARAITQNLEHEAACMIDAIMKQYPG